MTNKQSFPAKINGTKSKEVHLKLTTVPPYSKSFEIVKKDQFYIGQINSKYSGNFYITACTVPKGGSIFAIRSTAWFADPRYVTWGKDGVVTDFWMKDNGEIRGATSGQWLYGVVASFDSSPLDYTANNSLQFGVHDYNAFVDKDDSAWLIDVSMTDLKQCDNGQKMPPQSKFIQSSLSDNSSVIDQSGSDNPGSGSTGSEVPDKQIADISKGLPPTSTKDNTPTKSDPLADDKPCTIWYKADNAGTYYPVAKYPETYYTCQKAFHDSKKHVDSGDVGAFWGGVPASIDHFQWNGKSYTK